jgi:glycerophosphoryl diester phosphodiesterase
MSAPGDGRQVVRIAHRGGGSLAPENSIKGIETSIGYGIEFIEVDVRRTRDDALVLCHDPEPHGSTTPVARSTLSELRAEHPGIATLDDALETAHGRAQLNIDVKEPGTIDQILERVRAHDATGECMVSCLDARCLARLGEAEPSISRFLSYPPDYGGASTKPWLAPAVSAVVAGMRATMPMRLERMLAPAPGVSATIYYKLVSRRLVATARRLGVRLYTWTVDEPLEMQHVIALGVDGITSNRPDLLAQLDARPATAQTR